MFFKTRNSVKILDVDLDLSAMPSMRSAKLISIVGSGQLKKQMAPIEDERYAYHSLITMTLNQIPLVQMIQPGCPTCASLLAAGLGIEHADCEALRKLEDPLNQPFVSLDQSITQMEPLLSLLESGLYVVGEGICMPTDGEGHFFWDIQNTWTESAATAGAFIGSDYEYVSGWPLYLYPTETSACLNPERVTHYEELFRTSAARPRALVYSLNEFMNFILDGHHKACAAARLRQPLDCLFIIPVSGIAYSRDSKRQPKQFYFSSIPVSADQLPARFQAAFHPLRREEKAVKLQDLPAELNVMGCRLSKQRTVLSDGGGSRGNGRCGFKLEPGPGRRTALRFPADGRSGQRIKNNRVVQLFALPPRSAAEGVSADLP